LAPDVLGISTVDKKLAREAAVILAAALLLGAAANLIPSRHLAWWGQGTRPPEASVDFRLIDPFTADQVRTSLPRVVVIDTRLPEQYLASHVMGAVRLSYTDLARELTPALLESLHKADAVILYGLDDDGDMEQLLAQELRRRDVQTSSIIIGGFPAWEQGGLPVEGDRP
jgi:rhodanese-related sulfurtransferase